MVNEDISEQDGMFDGSRDHYFSVGSDPRVEVVTGDLKKLAAVTSGMAACKFTGGDRGWKGDVPIVRFDCSKIKALGWKAQRSSAQAVSDSMKSLLEELSHA